MKYRKPADQPISKLADIMLNLPLTKLHGDLCAGKFNIDKVLTALCEVLSYYHCDLLLLTGRPSQLPGIQAIIRRNLPLPPGRILPAAWLSNRHLVSFP
ncbi:Uncharacterized protein conserved in bacteria, putative virulence factor [Kluyvera cryocrescens]|uniref:Uncharacterized protein conserved in bacteria, putative virulence factor n=1 Tax=Kluyvera cryocrescens TaxID=580 RepID=A0A485CX65_KLUCR|nr:Uncharacterized protein conserved in bacteria, putative virulence factor [Kluyvera cryocrescens]